MKYLMMLASLAAGFSANSAMADNGQASNNALAKMGFSNVRVMSDQEGMAVRGKFVFIFGASRASARTFGSAGATSTNGYIAGGRFFAIGGNGSSATSTTSILGIPIITASARASGSSGAFAF